MSRKSEPDKITGGKRPPPRRPKSGVIIYPRRLEQKLGGSEGAPAAGKVGTFESCLVPKSPYPRSAAEGEGAPFRAPLQPGSPPPTNKPLPLLSDFMAIWREGTAPTHAHCLRTPERVYLG